MGGHAVVQELLRQEQPPLADVAVDGHVHVLLEGPGQIELADEKVVRNVVQGQVPAQVAVDVADHVLDQLLQVLAALSDLQPCPGPSSTVWTTPNTPPCAPCRPALPAAA